MFKPHYGICVCHGQKRLLVVKSGLCKIGNDERRGKKSNVKKKNGSFKLQVGRRIKSLDRGTNKQSSSLDEKRLQKNLALSSKKRKPIFYSKKRTGEKQVFESILKERGPTSQISGAWLGEGFNPWWFSHVIPKSIAPGLRLDPRNIILKTPEEHTLWENHKHKIRDLPEWQWVFELEEKLKIEYNEQTNSNRGICR